METKGKRKSELKEFCAFANSTDSSGYLHPWIRGVAIQFWISQAADLLGPAAPRLGLAFTHWHAIRNGWPGYQLLPLSQALLRAPKRHARALAHTISDELDLNYVLLAQLDMVNEALGNAEAHVHERQEDCLERALLATLNPRQRSTMANAHRSPETPITISAHQHLHGVVYQTARTDLLGLVDHGLLHCAQTGKKFTFTLKSPKP